MQAVIDFLLVYYVWILVVFVILLITVIGFLADTKKKKKMREKTITEGNNQQNVGMMDVNSVNGMNNMPNMNMNTGFNLNPVGDMNNNMFNQNMGNNMGNEVNNFNSMPNNNNLFFNSVPEQTPSFEPKPVEPVNIMNNNMNSVPTPVVEPTPVSVNPVPEVTNVNGMQNNYGVVDNQVIGNTMSTSSMVNEVPNLNTNVDTMNQTNMFGQNTSSSMGTSNSQVNMEMPMNNYNTPVQPVNASTEVNAPVNNSIPGTSNMSAGPTIEPVINQAPINSQPNINNGINTTPQMGPQVNPEVQPAMQNQMNNIPNMNNQGFVNQNVGIPNNGDNWKL